MRTLTLLPGESAPALTASPPPAPFELRMRPGIGDAMLLVGHDANGQPIIEVRLPRSMEVTVAAPVADFIRAWCRQVHELGSPRPHLTVVRGGLA